MIPFFPPCTSSNLFFTFFTSSLCQHISLSPTSCVFFSSTSVICSCGLWPPTVLFLSSCCLLLFPLSFHFLFLKRRLCFCIPSAMSSPWGAFWLNRGNLESRLPWKLRQLSDVLLADKRGERLQHHSALWTVSDRKRVWHLGNIWWWVALGSPSFWWKLDRKEKSLEWFRSMPQMKHWSSVLNARFLMWINLCEPVFRS